MDRHEIICQVRTFARRTPGRSGVRRRESLSAVTGTALPIVLTGSDAEGSALVFSIVSEPQHGALTGIPPDLTYGAVDGFLGTDSFSFKVNDGSDDSAIATVTIEFSTEYPLGADILIESDDVHRYTGSGTNWSWVTDGAANVAVGGDIGELSVSRQLLGNPQDMRIYLLAVNTPYGGIGVRSLPRRSD